MKYICKFPSETFYFKYLYFIRLFLFQEIHYIQKSKISDLYYTLITTFTFET